MTDAFSAATATLFADENVSTAAVYTPAGGGSPVTLRVLKRIPPVVEAGGAGRSQAAIAPKIFGLMVADVPTQPPTDSTLQIGAVTYIIESSQLAARETYWACDVRPGP